MADEDYKLVRQYMDGDVVEGHTAVSAEEARQHTNRVVVMGGGRPRLGEMLAGLAAGLFAAAAPMQPLIIMSRRAAADDLLDGVVYSRSDGPVDLVPAPDIGAGVRRVLGSDTLVTDDPWNAAMEAEQRRLSGVSFDDVLARTLGNPGLGLLGMLAPGACSYRPTGTKRTRRRAAGKAHEAMRKDFYRTLTNEGFGMGCYAVPRGRRGEPVVEIVATTQVSADTAHAWGLGRE